MTANGRKQNGASGFTLVELLVVVAIIAIISGMVVGLMSGTTDKAAASVSMAIQKQLMNQINSYMALHNQTMPDKFDSLIRSDYVAQAGTYSTVGSLAIADNLALFMAPACPATANTMPQNVNRGLHTDSYLGSNRVLTVCRMASGDVSALNGLGLYTVYDHATNDLFHGGLGYTARAITTNQPICIVDPQSNAGQSLYKDLGIDLSDSTAYPKDANGELTATGRQAAFTKQVFYVVALGPNCNMIGDQNAGLQEAPSCGVVSYGFYKHFMVVIKKAMGPYSQTAALAGILDAKGHGASAAREVVNSIR